MPHIFAIVEYKNDSQKNLTDKLNRNAPNGSSAKSGSGIKSRRTSGRWRGRSLAVLIRYPFWYQK